MTGISRWNRYIERIFEARAARAGVVVRRSTTDVERFASEDGLKKAVQERGVQMVLSGDQYVIFCNSGQFRVIC